MNNIIITLLLVEQIIEKRQFLSYGKLVKRDNIGAYLAVSEELDDLQSEIQEMRESFEKLYIKKEK